MGLYRALKKVESVWDTEYLLNQEVNEAEIIRSFTASSLAYHWVHSSAGSIHMALNPAGKFSKAGYYGQADLVAQHIRETGAQKVLEIGCGRGFNSLHLAANDPDLFIHAIDLTPRHIALAKVAADRDKINNVNFVTGDFAKMPFPEQSFDLVFAIETMCYAKYKPKILLETKRVLGSGKRIVIIDGFRTDKFAQLDQETQRAAALAERAMAVQAFAVLEEFLDEARMIGYKVLAVEDRTADIMPTIYRLARKAEKYYYSPMVAHWINKLLPEPLMQNSVAALLMPHTIACGAHSYQVIVLES